MPSLLVASCLVASCYDVVVWPGATSSFLLLVAMPLFLVASSNDFCETKRPGALAVLVRAMEP